MALEIYNSLGRKRVPFQSIEPGRVRMYHCGPTVKEPIHIGKFRSFLLADVLRRYFELQGSKVTQVMNITDVGHLNEFEEDVVEIAAGREGLYAWEKAEREVSLFHDDRRELQILDADVYPKAREHVEDMIATIRELEATGACYRAGGNLYLDIESYGGFGKLVGESREVLAERMAESRTQSADTKRNALDIDLWRTDALHQMHWESPWGRGFPGWHVECVAMGRKYLGEAFDIHTGHDDNIFPHHECELAQAAVLAGGEGSDDSARGQLASYWMHTGPVLVEGEPMDVRNRNVVSVRELLQSGFRGAVIRTALLSSHYREALDFGEQALDRAREAVNTLLGFREHLLYSSSRARLGIASHDAADWTTKTDLRFRAALDDDLDWWGALSAVVETIDGLEPDDVGSPIDALRALQDWNHVLGIL